MIFREVAWGVCLPLQTLWSISKQLAISGNHFQSLLAAALPLGIPELSSLPVTSLSRVCRTRFASEVERS